MIALDTETTGPDFHHGCLPFMVTICDLDGNTRIWEWPVDPRTRIPKIVRAELSEILNLIADNDIVMHNALFDVRAIESAAKHLGVTFNSDWLLEGVHDTMLMSHALDSYESHKLKDLAVKYGEIPDDDEKELSKIVQSARTFCRNYLPDFRTAKQGDPHFPHLRQTTWWKMDMWLPAAVVRHSKLKTKIEMDRWIEATEKYATFDAVRTSTIYKIFYETLHEQKLWDQYIENRRMIPVAYSIGSVGVRLNTRSAVAEQKRVETALQKFRDSAKRLSGMEKFNIDSPQDIVKAIDLLGITPKEFTPKGTPTTKSAAINSLLKEQPSGSKRKRFIMNLLFFRKHKKTQRDLDGYLAGQIQERLHTDVNICGTGTTRVSSSNPNLQNVGKAGDARIEGIEDFGLNMRRAFGPDEHHVWYPIDYEQLQLRIFAFVSNEKTLLDAFDQGWDAHDVTTRRIFSLSDDVAPTKEQRVIGKNVNFGFIFGASPAKIEETAGRPGLWGLVTRMFPNAHKFIKKTSQHVLRHGCVYTTSGYRLTVPKDKDYKGVNYIVQGDEGIIVKRAMVDAHEYLKRTSGRLILTVHDELIFEFPTSVPHAEHVFHLKEIMERAGESLGFKTPTSVSRITSSWDQSEEVDILRQSLQFRFAKRTA